MLDQDKILNFLKVTGPTLPTKVAKNINTDILLASAHLSDLSSQGKVKISKLKIGGSPLYYLPGDESQLYNFASGNINPKDLLVLDELKEKKILRESNLELIQRVGLRNLPDFAVPLNVRVSDKIELFWKWHLSSNDDANQMIGAMLTGVKETVLLEEVPAVEGKLAEVAEIEVIPAESETKQEIPIVAEEISKSVESDEPAQPAQEETEEPAEKEETAEKEQRGKALSSVKPETEPEKQQEQEASIKEEAKPIEEEELKEKEEVKFKEEKQKKLTEEKKSSEEKKPFLQKVKEKIIRKKKKVVVDDFSPQVQSFFETLRIMIENKDIIRKNSEINYFVKVPSAVGHIIYFCKAKSKSKCDEKDLSTAYMEAQVKKLPLLFLYTNEITKKAEEMLESGVFENAVIRKLNNRTE